MCGIAGFTNRQTTWREDITNMISRLKHRGPDRQDTWTSEDRAIVFGHTRLSILDLSEAGNQPMDSQDGRYVLILNGEIYNYRDLRERLQKENKIQAFRGHSDTEALLEYISAYGIKQALIDSTGMFAFALFDRKQKRLFLARDRIGEKPLYYGFVNQSFVFASELGAIAELGKEKFNIDQGALRLYLRRGYIPAPYSIYQEIRKAEAGEIIELDAPYRTIQRYKYWNLMDVAKFGEDHPFSGSENDAAEELERLIRNSIRMQLQADVPVGAFLSGGIDSATVVALAQEESREQVRTFSIGFEEEAYNEAPAAKEIARHLGTDHTEFYVSTREAIDTIPKLAYFYSEPFADSSQIPTFLVSKLAKEKVTVSLSGDGGDELFCGYLSYQGMRRRWNLFQKTPYLLRCALSSCARHIPKEHAIRLNELKYYLGKKNPEEIFAIYGDMSMDINHLSEEHSLPNDQMLSYPSGWLQSDVIENIMLMDMLEYLPDDILVKVDRSAMAVSLESRIPFLNKDIVSFAWTLPHSYKHKDRDTKRVLRKVLYRYVPKELMDRPKKGFGVPVLEWIKHGELREWAEDLLSPAKIRTENLLPADEVTHIWEDFKQHGRGGVYVWYLLMLEEWMEKSGNRYFTRKRRN